MTNPDLLYIHEHCYIEDDVLKFCEHMDYEYMYDKYPEKEYVDIYYECNICGYEWVIGASYDELGLELKQ